ncbi:hypothetical protein [Desulfococcus sp.]|uniref:hypothetical protein n=1 Tax=Desulfococcus sp. TaxID=2025834 RepID=UPI003594622F
MTRLFPAIIIIAALLSCARMPAVSPVPPEAAQGFREACARVFPAGDWQLVHAIETVMGGRRGTMMGVSVISPGSRTVHCALMTLEGLSMFEARDRDGRITVDRAVPPFDSPAFARGMLEDIRMIFFQPGPGPDEAGLAPSGSPLCRYRPGPDETVDVTVDPRGGWTLRRYEGAALVRTVHAGAGTLIASGGVRISRHLQLTARGPRPYTLDLKLLEAVPLAPHPRDPENGSP